MSYTRYFDIGGVDSNTFKRAYPVVTHTHYM